MAVFHSLLAESDYDFTISTCARKRQFNLKKQLVNHYGVKIKIMKWTKKFYIFSSLLPEQDAYVQLISCAENSFDITAKDDADAFQLREIILKCDKANLGDIFNVGSCV